MPGKGRRRKQPEACESEAPSGKKRKERTGEAAASSSGPASEVPAAAEEFVEDGEDEEEEEEEEDDEPEEVVEEGEEEEEEEEEEGGDGAASEKRIWRPGLDQIEEGEQLDVEPGTYDMLHRAQVEWPCLSFDILRDDLGAQRTTYPMTAYVVAGTQAEQVADNRIYMMKWSRLYKTSKDGKEDEEDEDDDESSADSEEHEAALEFKGVPHPGGVNRIRAMPQASHIVATWADSGKVHMWNLQSQRKALDNKGVKLVANPKPIYTCEAHKGEGFAMDFNPHNTGHFLSGDNSGAIFLWEPVQGGWNVGSGCPFSGHTSSVEDVHWKRDAGSGKCIFASCSADHSVRVWDVREKNRVKAAVHIAKAHDSDVNAISWSPCVAELIVTGADDGGFKIWDTRNTSAGPMANFRWHRKPIVSVDWHPTDETVLAVASDDDSISLWDMAVEDDTVGREGPPGADHFPAQLLFLHQGQREPKELRWHPQLPSVCVTTAGSGFNIFKTCNI